MNTLIFRNATIRSRRAKVFAKWKKEAEELRAESEAREGSVLRFERQLDYIWRA